MQQEEDSINISLVDNATQFHKSLQELRDLSSQFYNAAEYCETTFFTAQDKRIVMENTKQYVSRAVVTVVDHFGSISANLESSLSQTNSFPQTEHKIDVLKLKIVACQQRSHKIAVSRFYLSPGFSRHHCRYILPPLTDSEKMNVASRGIEANNGKEEQFETEEPLFLHTYNCKPSLVEKSPRDGQTRNGLWPPVVPVRGDGLSILPKSDQLVFQFQGSGKLKRSMINWKQLQNKEIASLIRRGKRILA